jgi:hypothetical protein
MYRFQKCLCCAFLFLSSAYLTPLSAFETNSRVQTRNQPEETYQIYNQNYYTQPNYSYPSPYYGYYGSIPPPGGDAEFPDDAEQNALYQELQDR